MFRRHNYKDRNWIPTESDRCIHRTIRVSQLFHRFFHRIFILTIPFLDSYLPPQFGPYIHGHPPNSHVRGPAPPSSSGDDPKGKKVAVAPPTTTALPPGPPHPSQLAQYEALKAAGGPHYNSPYPAPHPGAIMRHQGDPQAHPDAPSNPGEFSGLVSYFSAQHDDLEQQ